ncbi:MAG TPA: hypothetical protein VNH19_04050, partial [Candidatus Limnocylindrales bacterium]|nr:hypothetical protein [Candidatus Limnocylindrales bacterium]
VGAAISRRVEFQTSKVLNGPAAAQQVKDENHNRYHQQHMDEASTHMKTETQEPQNSQNNDECPKHPSSPLLMVALFHIEGGSATMLPSIVLPDISWNTAQNCSHSNSPGDLRLQKATHRTFPNKN